MNLWNELLLSVVEVSISTGVIILILCWTAPFFNKRYALHSRKTGEKDESVDNTILRRKQDYEETVSKYFTAV